MRTSIFTFFFSLFFAAASLASDLFTYQGKLTDAEGLPLPDGQYVIGVRVWENEVGGDAPLWARKYDVPVQSGVFSLMVGAPGEAWGIIGEPGGPLTASLKLALSSGNRHLDITVMSDANGPEKPEAQWQTLQPRQSLNAVPYAMNGVPTGTVVPFAGGTAPDGWLICDGVTTLPISDPRYNTLYQAIGTAFNIGDEPEGHFRLPDMRGRTAIGAGRGQTWVHNDEDLSTNWLRGQRFGAERHVLSISEMPSHKHNARDTGHSHPIQMYGDWASGTRAVGTRRPANETSGQGGTLSSKANIVEDAVGGDEPHNNMQPSLVLNYIIKL